ncbi:hypothetical protein JYU34_021132 [Plutella xylostella]|uniref:Ribosomal protein n=1 Tax=Plutella xylostella TaxID=51655 RepID=A0ABQ7PST6_PLUXY|nr:hypothetical protein JYU34_021132 [Plutella xylostella]
MQRIVSIARTITSLGRCLPNKTMSIMPSYFSLFQQNVVKERMLVPCVPTLNQVCGFKVKGRLRRRCKSCYFVVREERLYVICPKFPRHKQMAMKPKPHNTWILTHASQSPVRPW